MRITTPTSSYYEDWVTFVKPFEEFLADNKHCINVINKLKKESTDDYREYESSLSSINTFMNIVYSILIPVERALLLSLIK